MGGDDIAQYTAGGDACPNHKVIASRDAREWQCEIVFIERDGEACLDREVAMQDEAVVVQGQVAKVAAEYFDFLKVFGVVEVHDHIEITGIVEDFYTAEVHGSCFHACEDRCTTLNLRPWNWKIGAKWVLGAGFRGYSFRLATECKSSEKEAESQVTYRFHILQCKILHRR